MNHSSFIQDNSLGNKIITGLLDACNVTTYYNTATMETIYVPFAPCGQAYVLGEQITILGQPMTVLGE